MAEPILFDNGTFSYEGRKYVFDARILYKVGGKEDGISLSRSHILDAEFGVSLNRLYSDGFVVYRDVVGDISRVIGVFDAVCVITMLRYAQQGDGGFDSEKVDESLVHSFVVDNVEIVERDGTSITYCIHLKGTEYQRLMNHVEYSDYATGPSSVVSKVMSVLAQFGGCQLDDSFADVTSGVHFNYMSNGNDTVLTVVDYLMQRQFFYPDRTDERMKFLVYDIQSGKYGMFQFGQSECPAVYPLYLSMDGTQMEEFTSQEMVRLASISDMSRTDMILPLSKIVTRTFSLDSNEFAMYEHKSSAIARFFGGGDDSNNKVHELEYDDSHNPVRDVSEWCNGENVYRDAVDMFMNWDSIRVNAGGVLGRRLMSMVSITVDQRLNGSIDDTTEEVNRRKTRYQQLQGPWYVTDVRYIVKPSEGTFKQNLQLSRCFNVS